MPIARLDHVTVCTRDVPRALAFYRDVVGLEAGSRPEFSFDGAWMYAGGMPVVHVVDREASRGGVIDHFAFFATDLPAYLSNLRQRGIAYEMTTLPAGVPQSGTRQVFFRDPDGARIEVDFAADETAA